MKRKSRSQALPGNAYQEALPRNEQILKSIIILTIILILCSCSRTGPSRFYILNSLSDTESSFASKSSLIIGIGPVDIPDYLERPQIVTRTSQNNLVLAEYDKWAGSLKHDISLVLAENLSVVLNTDNVFVYPWKGDLPVQYQIKLEIIRFDAEHEKEAVLIAHWLILGKDGRKVLKMKKSKISRPIKEKGYDAIVSAQSQTLALLSHDIAGAVNAIK